MYQIQTNPLVEKAEQFLQLHEIEWSQFYCITFSYNRVQLQGKMTSELLKKFQKYPCTIGANGFIGFETEDIVITLT